MFFRLFKNTIKTATFWRFGGGYPPSPPPPLNIASAYGFIVKSWFSRGCEHSGPPRRVVANATSCSKRTALRDVAEVVWALSPPQPPLRGVGAASPLRGRSYTNQYAVLFLIWSRPCSGVIGWSLKSLYVVAGWKWDFQRSAKSAWGGILSIWTTSWEPPPHVTLVITN